MQFFQKIFLVADIAIEVVLGMFFLTLNNIEINFADREHHWKIYTLD